MKPLINTCLAYYRTVLMVLGMCLIWGIAAYITIPKESKPDVKIPTLYVSVAHSGISPEDAERLIVKPLEDTLQDIDGLKELKAFAFEGGASIILKFQAGFDSDRARQDVIEKVNLGKNKLPTETKDPVITEINLSLMPILLIKISGNGPLPHLYKVANKLKDQIEKNVKTVQKAKIIGSQKEILEVNIDPDILDLYKINLMEIVNNIRHNNQLISAGTINQKKVSLLLSYQDLLLITKYYKTYLF